MVPSCLLPLRFRSAAILLFDDETGIPKPILPLLLCPPPVCCFGDLLFFLGLPAVLDPGTPNPLNASDAPIAPCCCLPAFILLLLAFAGTPNPMKSCAAPVPPCCCLDVFVFFFIPFPTAVSAAPPAIVEEGIPNPLKP